MKFTLTDEHLKLLSRAYIWWDDVEYGAPGIDPKRPYGNSDVETDIAEILGWKSEHRYIYDQDGNIDPRFADEATNDDRAWKIHKELEIALQIVLNILPDWLVGIYERGKDGWQLTEDDDF